MSKLIIEELVKIYEGKAKACETKALNGVNLKVEDGELVAVMGPSGSGKTTLLNILSGIDKETTGKVMISGKSLHEMKKDELALYRRKHLGFVFQEFNLLDSLTIKENVMLPMILDNKDLNEMETKTKEIMTLFHIDQIMDKYPYMVSGGQQQRAAVCRAIINDPDIIFADEPTGNLDSKASKIVMECFNELHSLQKTVLIVTHDAFAACYCNRVIFIKDGLVHSEILKKDTRKKFFDDILEALSVIGGENNDL
jgi:ABC-type antimicrobial peptide transport system, ATPase component